MTIDQFVTALRASFGPWELQPPMHPIFRDRIRREVGGRLCCPITALGKVSTYPAGYPADAQALGLDPEDAETIAVTADGYITHRLYDPKLRRRLEAATVSRLVN